MTRICHLAVMLGVIALCAAPLRGDTTFRFDELGNLSVSLGGGPFLAQPDGTLEADPTGGVAGDVLVYNLTSELSGFSFFNGDVPIGGSGSIVGDLRFTDQNGSLTGSEVCGGAVECLMIFYVFDSNGLPADVGPISTSFLTTQTPGASVNSAGAFSYSPGVLSYDGTIVPKAPEPSSVVLLGLGLLGIVGFAKFKAATP